MEDFLRAIGLEQHLGAFLAEGVDASQFPLLTDADLRELGLNMGERKRFLQAAQRKPEPATAVAAATLGERRPMTMMFIDMVNSSGIADELEAEDLLELLRVYREYCGQAIMRTGGRIARFIGDGILAYFCYPVATENDPERSVRAALDIVANIGRIRFAAVPKIHVRIGIATGSVIVSDLFAGGEQDKHSVIGSTPNLAARLQGFAPTDGIVIAQETYDRVAGLFECEDLGEAEVRGFRLPHRAWRVLRENAGAARRRAPQRATAMHGREAELATLTDAWRSTAGGAGQVVLVAGEAGIGKSRLVAQFLADHARGCDAVVTLSGSDLDQDSPFHPILSHLRTAASLDDSEGNRLDRLAAALALPAQGADGAPIDRAEAVALVARLLGLPAPSITLDALSPRQLRDRSIAVLAEVLLAAAASGPACLLVEDLHWIDPSTLEVLARVAEATGTHRLLMLLTARPDAETAWLHGVAARRIDLARLEAAQLTAIIRDTLADMALPADVLARITSRTDGVPLFALEIARAVLQAGEAIFDDPDEQVPASLQESLMARLDRVGDAKQVAQTASLIGRTVSYRVLANVIDLPEHELNRCLDALVDAGILLVTWKGGRRDSCAFTHALVRDIAYDSLLRDRRRALHLKVARVLDWLDPDFVRDQPQAMATHLYEAGEMYRAAQNWLEAGKRSLAGSALTEATRLLRRGVAALDRAVPSPDVTTLRFEILGLLGPALMSLLGPGAPETQRLYDESYRQCQEIEAHPLHFPIYWGWWRVAPDCHALRERSASILARARAHGDDGFLLQAHHCNWAYHFNVGDFTTSCEHVETGLRIYGDRDWRHHPPLYGNHDVRTCAHGELSLMRWMQGRPGMAAQENDRALAWAVGLNHLGSRIHAMDIGLTFRAMRRDHRGAFDAAGDLASFTAEHGLKDHAAKSRIYRGWTVALNEDVAQGLGMLRDGFAMQHDIGTSEDFPFYVCMLAESLIAAGKADEAVEELHKARTRFEEQGLNVWLPEVVRMTAEAMLAADPGASAMAEAVLHEAAQIAASQRVPMLSLRIAASRARLLDDRGDIEAAERLLALALDQIPEPDEGEDIAAVRGQIARLRQRLGHKDTRLSA